MNGNTQPSHFLYSHKALGGKFAITSNPCELSQLMIPSCPYLTLGDAVRFEGRSTVEAGRIVSLQSDIQPGCQSGREAQVGQEAGTVTSWGNHLNPVKKLTSLGNSPYCI